MITVKDKTRPVSCRWITQFLSAFFVVFSKHYLNWFKVIPSSKFVLPALQWVWLESQFKLRGRYSDVLAFFSLSPLAIPILQNSLISSGCTCFCCPLHLCYSLTNMSLLSSKITPLEVNSRAFHTPPPPPPPPRAGFTQVPAEPWKGDTSYPEAATSKAGESSTSLPASMLVSLLLLPLTLIQAAILLTSGSPKSCPAAGEQKDSASAFGYSPSQPPHFSGPHFCRS